MELLIVLNPAKFGGVRLLNCYLNHWIAKTANFCVFILHVYLLRLKAIVQQQIIEFVHKWDHIDQQCFWLVGGIFL